MNKLTDGYKDTSKALGQMSDAESQLIDGNQQVESGLEQMAPMAGAQESNFYKVVSKYHKVKTNYKLLIN